MHANQVQHCAIQLKNYSKLVLVQDGYLETIFNPNTGWVMTKTMGSLQQLLHI